MSASIQMSSYFSFIHFNHPAFLNFLSSEQVKRIRQISIAIFSKMSGIFKAFNNQNKEINIKTIAMISCLSLIALLVISMLPRRNAHLQRSAR